MLHSFKCLTIRSLEQQQQKEKIKIQIRKIIETI